MVRGTFSVGRTSLTHTHLKKPRKSSENWASPKNAKASKVLGMVQICWNLLLSPMAAELCTDPRCAGSCCTIGRTWVHGDWKSPKSMELYSWDHLYIIRWILDGIVHCHVDYQKVHDIRQPDFSESRIPHKMPQFCNSYWFINFPLEIAVSWGIPLKPTHRRMSHCERLYHTGWDPQDSEVAL